MPDIDTFMNCYRPKEMREYCKRLSKSSLLSYADFLKLANQLSKKEMTDRDIKKKLDKAAKHWTSIQSDKANSIYNSYN